MIAGLIITGSEALIYPTSHKKFMDENLIKTFETKGFSFKELGKPIFYKEETQHKKGENNHENQKQ